MLVILDDGPRRVFSDPTALIQADRLDEVPAALAAVEAALKLGSYVAGWLGYELGYALESRLGRQGFAGPLLRLGVFGPPKSVAPAAPGRAYAGPLMPDWSEAQYAARFAAVKNAIAAGDIYQANLSFRSRFAFAGDPQAFYERLLAESGAGHCGFVGFPDEKNSGERQIVSSHVAGDFIDLEGSILNVVDHNIQALTRCEVSMVRRTDLLNLVNAHPRIALAMR